MARAAFRRWQALAMVPALALVGCAHVVDGQPSAVPIGVVEDALPSAAELQSALGAPLKADGAPKVGAGEALRNDADEYTSPECARVTHPLLIGTYQHAGLDHVAFGIWQTVEGPGNKPPGVVRVGIVEMDSPAGAESFYADSEAAWADCRGRTVTHYMADTMTLVDRIVGVDESDGVVRAALELSDEVGAMTPTPHQRALGVVSRYVVDVDVYGRDWPAGDMDRAAAVARLTIGKIRAAR